MYTGPYVLSDGLAPFGEFIPFRLQARLSGQGNIIHLEREGTGRSFPISFGEVDELEGLVALLRERMQEERVVGS